MRVGASDTEGRPIKYGERRVSARKDAATRFSLWLGDSVVGFVRIVAASAHAHF
jgi:hypothetical protein